MNILDLSEVAKNVSTSLAIIFGGIWTYWKFFRHGEDRPMIIFELDLRVIEKIENSWIVELICVFENKGKVRHKISVDGFVYNLRFLKQTDEIKNGFLVNDRKYSQLYFPHKFIVNESSSMPWLPKDWVDTYIEPGIRQKYSTVVAIPADVTVLLIHSKFAYEKSPKEYHTANGVFKIGY